jgi:hypothetical protein
MLRFQLAPEQLAAVVARGLFRGRLGSCTVQLPSHTAAAHHTNACEDTMNAVCSKLLIVVEACPAPND